MTTLDSSVDDMKKYISEMLLFLNEYRCIIDAYVSDFFVDNLYERVPSKWWNVLQTLQPEELASLINGDTWKSSKTWPLSLIAFRSVVTKIWPRQENNAISLQELDWKKKFEYVVSETTSFNGDNGLISMAPYIKDGQHHELGHCYRRHVKPKKQHEIIKLTEVISSLCQLCSCDHVVDVGAGQGHLARLLCFGCGIQVTTVEAESCHTPVAQKYDREVINDVKKGKIVTHKVKKKKVEPGEHAGNQWPEPSHVVAKITPDMSPLDFLNVLCTRGCLSINENCHETNPNHPDFVYDETLSKAHSLKKQDMEAKEVSAAGLALRLNSAEPDTVRSTNANFVLNGLHACGDLTSTMIRVFVQCPQAVGLASVSCCYMKLSTECVENRKAMDNDVFGYPLSCYVSNLPEHYLSYEAREMACHFVDCYHNRLQNNLPQLRRHAYRAALQEIILQKAPHIKHGTIKLTVKHTEKLSFKQYAELALRKLNLNEELNDEQIKKAEARIERWRHVVAFYTLRLSLAPLVEMVVLLDRALYLIENGIPCKLLPVFDPRLSPRNYVLIAKK